MLIDHELKFDSHMSKILTISIHVVLISFMNFAHCSTRHVPCPHFSVCSLKLKNWVWTATMLDATTYTVNAHYYVNS